MANAKGMTTEDVAGSIEPDHEVYRMVATTTQPSGYDGSALPVSAVDVDEPRSRVEPGDHVWTSDQVDVGKANFQRYHLGPQQ